jgi:site-specific DNA recombinase
MLFRRYLELGSVVRLKTALDAEGIVTPTRIAGTGRASGGKRVSRGHLYWILSNPIYIGRLRHKGQEHNGLHSGVIEPETWQAVQEKLHSQTQLRRQATKDELSFLAGKLFDDRGHRMGATFAAKGSRRWRYYVSRAALTGRNNEAGAVAWVSAPTIEALVIDAVKRRRSEAQRRNEVRRATSTLSGATAHDERTHDRNPNAEAVASFAEAIERVTLARTHLEIVLSGFGDDEETTSTIVVPWTPDAFRRRRDIIQPTAPDTSPKRAMRARAREVFATAIVDAHRWLDELLSDPTASIAALADRERKSERSIRMTLSLAFLAPDLVKSACDGKLPRGFNTTRLVSLPMLWPEQWSALGLQPPMGERGV